VATDSIPLQHFKKSITENIPELRLALTATARSYPQAFRATLRLPLRSQLRDALRVENNNLIIKGERKFEREEKEENFRRVERQYGTFVRSFALPSTVDPDNINANYDKGVLSISLPKRVEAKPKQIQVNTGK